MARHSVDLNNSINFKCLYLFAHLKKEKMAFAFDSMSYANPKMYKEKVTSRQAIHAMAEISARNLNISQNVNTYLPLMLSNIMRVPAFLMAFVLSKKLL